jgi:hypothetical protein
MTHEYLRAAETYRLSYADLKRLARQSLEHSFLPGASLSSNPACAAKASATCEKFLQANQRARVQWKLEQEFAAFEQKY